MNVKVLHVIDSAGLYGAEVMLLGLMAEQRRQGVEPQLASIGTPDAGEKVLEREARRQGTAVIPFRMTAGPNLPGACRILGYAKSAGVDVIHSHGYKGNILLGLIPGWLRPAPMVTTVHGWTAGCGFSRMKLYELMDGVALRFVERVVVVSNAALAHPRLRSISRERVRVVPNGIPDPASAAPPSDPVLARFMAQRPTISAAGRLSPEKGFHHMLDAFSLLLGEGYDAQLVIFGEGGERAALEERVAALGLVDRVRLPGYVPDLGNFLPLSRLFAMSSLTEGLPMVLLEAMRSGIPVVATSVGGIPELLQCGDTGVMVPPADPAELARGMAWTLKEVEAASAKAKRARALVAERYSVRAMERGYLGVYREVAQQGAR